MKLTPDELNSAIDIVRCYDQKKIEGIKKLRNTFKITLMEAVELYKGIKDGTIGSTSYTVDGTTVTNATFAQAIDLLLECEYGNSVANAHNCPICSRFPHIRNCKLDVFLCKIKLSRI